MPRIEVPFIETTQHNAIEEIADVINNNQRNGIENIPWPAFNYKPNVEFSIAHSNSCVYLKYYVNEQAIKAVYVNTNDPVYKDTCVEFFLSFQQDKEYYNFEFNCIGTRLAAFGSGKENRRFLPADIINNIKFYAVIKNEAHGITWELTVAIPLNVFCFHKLSSIKGMKCFANFYKCGDELPQPHFLSWAPVESTAPNFHLRNFFEEIHFL